MSGPLVISLIPKEGDPRYTVFECNKGARLVVARCGTLDEALHRIKEIRAAEKALYAL